MCGIIAVLRRPAHRPPPAPPEVLHALERAWDVACRARGAGGETAQDLDRVADKLAGVDDLLRGAPGLRCLLSDSVTTTKLEARAQDFEHLMKEIEAGIDTWAADAPAVELEATNTALIRAKDALWAIRRDRFRAAAAIKTLAGPQPSKAAIDAFASIHTALAALDRLEVRGRDSAGLHVLITGHNLDLQSAEIASRLAPRSSDHLFTSQAVRTPLGHLSVVYKAASEVGELGDNGRCLRAAIMGDALLHRALAAESAEAVVVGHTRWASVGMISEANAHPLNHEEVECADSPYAIAVLNGDVDNYAALVERHGLRVPPEITTDAKVIPALLSRRLAAGESVEDAFRHTVAEFAGSVAVVAGVAADPDTLLLAVRGSGQALYVGLADDQYVVASEPYGLVEESSRYLRMDGEAGGESGDRADSRGQIIVLHHRQAGTLEGIRRFGYSGVEMPVSEADLLRAEITTRDIDRGEYSHYLLKEISEAPTSFRKTLRGRIRQTAGRLVVHLGPHTLPDALRTSLARGEIRRILVLGQGTAAIAAMSVAASINDALHGSGLHAVARPATEVSGFGLDDDMSDALVVAISQSGTTTDTNRSVDLLRARGATILAIVNRRGSDLIHKVDGVLFTSDGRDVEMSVASTKAFYAQVAAGVLLAHAFAQILGTGDPTHRHEQLVALRQLPEAMSRLLAQREHISALAHQHAPQRRHWAVVGSGHNQIAAEEIRIKLSELCYKSVACDTIENKKHIDLSSEPLTLVCAAGLSGSAADDVAKEVAIFRAHKGVPIVIASEGETRFDAAAGVIAVPAVHPAYAYVLAIMAGHLFGYEAALAIDAQATPLRQARAVIEHLVATLSSTNGLLEELGPQLEPAAADFYSRLRAGRYDGTLSAGTATRVASLLDYTAGRLLLEGFQLKLDRPVTPRSMLDDLVAALTAGIDELTRPIDAIKHQAKTVTVGISRAEEPLFSVPLVRHVLVAGADRRQLGYRTLKTLAALDPAVAHVTGFTRYRVKGDPADEAATIEVCGKGGVAQQLTSRAEHDPRLRGTKQLVAIERQVLTTRGRSDGRLIILVPEITSRQTIGLTLLHVAYHERLPASIMRQVLDGYRNRLTKLRSVITETSPDFDETPLGQLPVVTLLTDAIDTLAEHWRTATEVLPQP